MIVILFHIFWKTEGTILLNFISLIKQLLTFQPDLCESSLLTNIVLSPELSLDNSFE